MSFTDRDAGPPTYRFWGRAKPTQKLINRVSADVADTTAVIRLYLPIDSWGGSWGVSASEFADLIAELPDDVAEIRMHINSPGGEVFEAIAMVNTLRNHPARTVAIVDGIAASAASVLAVSCDETVMGRNSELMIHDASGFAMGNAALMHKMGDLLDHLSDNLAGLYATKAGGTKDDWRTAMREETWYSDEEAVAAGLADRIAGDAVEPTGDGVAVDDETGAPTATFDLSIFNYAGRSAAPPPRAQHLHVHRTSQPPAATRDGSSTTSQEGSHAVAFTPEQLTTLRQQVGVPEDADEATILGALSEALAERAEPQHPTATVPDGAVVIDAAQLAELRAAAQAGQDARNEQQRDARQRLVNAAVADGRIPPARRDHWVAQLEADPGAADVLATMAKGLVPVAELGHAGTPDASADDELFAQLFAAEKTGA